MANKTILVIGSGGDAPGMNPALRSVVRCWSYKGVDYKVIGCRDGYNGLLDCNQKLVDLDREKVAGIVQRGGCEIGAGRCEGLKKKGSSDRIAVKEALQRLKSNRHLKGMVVIGGNGSFTGMVDVLQNECNILSIGIPATIDNDIFDTDLTLGVDTALNTAVELIDKIRDTALAFGRPFVVELMGRDCGYLAMATAIATESEAVFIPEKEVDYKYLVTLQQNLNKLESVGLRDAVIIVAEGSKIKSNTLQNLLEIHLKRDVRTVVPGYTLRGGSPSAMDRLLACRMGYFAVQSIDNSLKNNIVTPDIQAKVVALKGTNIAIQSHVSEILKQSGKETWKNQPYLDELEKIQLPLATYKETPDFGENVGGALLIIHGADAPGINAAIRAFTRVALNPEPGNEKCKRFRTIAVRDGFKGLAMVHSKNKSNLFDYFIDMSWRNTVGFTLTGGVPTMLSQNPIVPIRASAKNWLEKDRDVKKAVKQMKKNIDNYIKRKDSGGQHCRIDIMVVIGGRDAIEWIKKIQQAGFHIPIMFIPASIDNDLCFTDYSIGFDTAVNNAMKAIDNIKETALAEGRIFLIETMGGLSGLLPLAVGMASGAEHIFIPEIFEKPGPEMIEIDQVAQDISEKFTSRKKTQSILIFHESVIKALGGIDAVSKAFEYFQIGDATTYGVRKTVLGYTLRGGHPTAFDRILATRLGAAAAFGITDALANHTTNKYKNGFAVAFHNNHIEKIPFDDLYQNKATRMAERQEKLKELAKIYCALANDKWMEERLGNITLFSDDWAQYDSSKLNIDLWKEFWKNRIKATASTQP